MDALDPAIPRRAARPERREHLVQLRESPSCRLDPSDIVVIDMLALDPLEERGDPPGPRNQWTRRPFARGNGVWRRERKPRGPQLMQEAMFDRDLITRGAAVQPQDVATSGIVHEP